jgi:hypothetical protein
VARNRHWSKEDSVEQVIAMFRSWSGATRNRCLRPGAAIAYARSATAISRSCALIAATATRSDRRWASATIACGRSARRGPCARRGSTAAATLQGRSFPRRTRRQWGRCEVCGRRTDACLRRYYNAVSRQTRNRPTAHDRIGRAAIKTHRSRQIGRGFVHRGLVTGCEGSHHQLNPGALGCSGNEWAKARRVPGLPRFSSARTAYDCNEQAAASAARRARALPATDSCPRNFSLSGL